MHENENMTAYEMVQVKIQSMYKKQTEPQMNRKLTYNSQFKKRFILEEADSGPKEIKGYLQKKSPSYFRGWQV